MELRRIRNICATTVVIAGLICGSVPAFFLYHDWVRMDGNWLDAVLHFLADPVLPHGVVYLVSILILLDRLSLAIAADRRRAAVVAFVWVSIGLASIAVATYASDYIQTAYNDDAYRRIDPDNFVARIGIGEGTGRDELRILDNPEAFDNYTWRQIIAREVAFTVLMAVAAAIAMRLASSRRPMLGALAVPLVLAVLLVIYVDVVAPWAYVLDYDVFVGDNILGSVAGSAFVFSPFLSDPVGGAVVFLYVVSIAVMVRCWRPKAEDSKAAAATAAIK
jgi:hypothetical protein